ncbi:MAG: BatA domain-containing protein [Deltaproteobacteria bacterium]|nr:BatA domain-containing protein [Deltaproteobacteria bacterium]
MSLFFLHPVYLFGLFAASLPLVIHLLNRRKLKKMRFPAVRFIVLSQRRIARSRRLRHWILLALRTLAICVLVLLLANPIFQSGAGLFAGGGSISLAIILDNSLSMKWSGEGEGLKQGREAAGLILSSLKEGDQAALILTNPKSGAEPRFNPDRQSLIRELDQIEISAGTADFTSALTRAYELLKEPAAQKEIWVITDAGLAGWDRFTLSSLRQYDPLVPVKIIKVERKEPLPNATIQEIRAGTQGVGVGTPTRLEAVLANFTDVDVKDLLVQLYIDEQKKDQKLVALPAKGELSVPFQFTLAQAGFHHGYVALRKAGLAGNATHYFTLQSQDRIKVLVVDGDPQTSLVQSETFFLVRALNPTGAQSSSLFVPTVIVPEGLTSTPLENYQVLILCNVPTVPDSLLPRLRDFVQKGGGLLFFAGDRVQAEDYNRKLFQSSPAILPALLREKKIAGQSDGEKIEKFDLAHPVLQSLSDPILKDTLRSTKVRGYFHSEASGRSALLTLGNGDALLSERKIGSGRVLFFATSADREWTDLPLKTVYLPLLQSVVSYLSGEKKGALDPGIAVGNLKAISLPPGYVGKSAKILKPDGKERQVTIGSNGSRASATFKENDLAGIYRLILPAVGDARDAVQFYSVNSPFLESRLQAISEQELQAKLRPIRAQVFPMEALKTGGKRTDLSFPLLFLLILTLGFESWLAQRIYDE